MAAQSSIISPLLDFSLPNMLGILVSATTIPSSLTKSSIHIMVNISAPISRKKELFDYLIKKFAIDTNHRKIQIPFKDLETNLMSKEFKNLYNKLIFSVVTPEPTNKRKLVETNNKIKKTKIRRDDGSITDNLNSLAISNSEIPSKTKIVKNPKKSKNKRKRLVDIFDSIKED